MSAPFAQVKPSGRFVETNVPVLKVLLGRIESHTVATAGLEPRLIIKNADNRRVPDHVLRFHQSDAAAAAAGPHANQVCK